MDVKLVEDREQWDALLTSCSYPPFTQLWSWGRIQEALGKRVIRVLATNTKKTLLCTWIQERRGPFVYWFAAQGPVISMDVTTGEVSEFIELSKRFLTPCWRTIFYRCEPRWRGVNGFVMATHGLAAPFVRVHSLNPSTSFVVPLTATAEMLFDSFHKKTRYNIRLAERHGVTVRIGNDKDWSLFLRLMKQTATRNEIRFHSDAYLTTVYHTLTQDGCARLRVAEYQGEALAIQLEVLCGDTVMYLYGASASEHREKMAPFALQWRAIQAAMEEGYRWYDFGGGNPTDTRSMDYLKSWEGITRFKEQWATERLMDSGTFDAPQKSLAYRLFVRR